MHATHHPPPINLTYTAKGNQPSSQNSIKTLKFNVCKDQVGKISQRGGYWNKKHESQYWEWKKKQRKIKEEKTVEQQRKNKANESEKKYNKNKPF